MGEYHPPTPKGLHVSPPNWKKFGTTYALVPDPDAAGLTSAGIFLHGVDSTSRRRRGLIAQIERELLRSCTLHNTSVVVGIGTRGIPFFYVPKSVAHQWLEDGGRAWILAEIAARAGRDVIPFPGRRA